MTEFLARLSYKLPSHSTYRGSDLNPNERGWLRETLGTCSHRCRLRAARIILRNTSAKGQIGGKERAPSYHRSDNKRKPQVHYPLTWGTQPCYSLFFFLFQVSRILTLRIYPPLVLRLFISTFSLTPFVLKATPPYLLLLSSRLAISAKGTGGGKGRVTWFLQRGRSHLQAFGLAGLRFNSLSTCAEKSVLQSWMQCPPNPHAIDENRRFWFLVDKRLGGSSQRGQRGGLLALFLWFRWMWEMSRERLEGSGIRDCSPGCREIRQGHSEY